MELTAKRLTFLAKPESPESFKRSLDRHRADISTGLSVLYIPWEDRFYGIEPRRRLEISLSFSGEIEVTGDDEVACKKKIEEILEVLDRVFGESTPYTRAQLSKIILDDSINASIESVVPGKILRVVKDRLMQYSVRDVSFGFSVEKEMKDVRIFFERPTTKPETQGLPLRIRVTASSEDVASDIQKRLKAELTP